jgi:nicotinate-nucleotide adenylyltransferase
MRPRPYSRRNLSKPMLRFHQGDPLRPGRLGVFPGAFNPLTNAHLALAGAARTQYELEQIAYLLPTGFPHKAYSEAPFGARLGMLRSALAGEPASAICSSDKGLFIEICEEFRAACGPDVEICFLCGRDAAERIVSWDYGSGIPFARQIERFQLLVASRGEDYVPPPEFRARIHAVELAEDYGALSSSAVREAVQRGKDWRRMVPGAVAGWIDREGLYGRGDRA